MPAAVPLYCVLRSLCQQSGTRTPAAHSLGTMCLQGLLYCPPEPTPRKQAPKLLLPKVLVPPTCSSHTQTSNQAPGLLLLSGLLPPFLQHLLWLQKAHAPTQVDAQASAAFWAPENSSPLDLLPQRHPQLATQCHKPTSTHASEHQSPSFTSLLVPRGFPPHRA
jgi:hypothetical protein